jgi:hypothetical protein
VSPTGLRHESEGRIASGSRLNNVDRDGRGQICLGTAPRRRQPKRGGLPVPPRAPASASKGARGRALGENMSRRSGPPGLASVLRLLLLCATVASPSRLRCRRPPSGPAAGRATTRTRACRLTGPCLSRVRASWPRPALRQAAWESACRHGEPRGGQGDRRSPKLVAGMARRFAGREARVPSRQPQAVGRAGDGRELERQLGCVQPPRRRLPGPGYPRQDTARPAAKDTSPARPPAVPT